jgi:hypothetical protein
VTVRSYEDTRAPRAAEAGSAAHDPSRSRAARSGTAGRPRRAAGLIALDPPAGSALFIENAGNLVCPALFDLGEHAKVVVTSVTEGDDKPLKDPHMFRASDAIVCPAPEKGRHGVEEPAGARRQRRGQA